MSTGLLDLDETTVSLDEFPALWAAHERDRARLALAVARFADTGEYGVDGAVTIAAWLREHCRMADTDASALVREGRFLATFTPVADAALDSTLSAGQVRALRLSVTRPTQDVFAECAADQVAAIAPLSVRDAEQQCAVWRQHAEAIVDMPEPCLAERKLSCKRAGDGAMLGNFVFDPALASEFDKALGNAATWEGAEDTRPIATRQADALFDICAFFNANHAKPGTPRHRAHIEMLMDADRVGDRDCCATTVDGYPYPASTADAFLCDSTIQRFVMNGSVPIDIGRASRTVPVHLFRAVATRDGGCRHPGCRRKIAWCDAHHIRHWRHGGATSLDNLVLLCARHHHDIHRPGWHLKLLPDGTLETTTPSGRILTTEPKPRTNTRLKHLKPNRP